MDDAVDPALAPLRDHASLLVLALVSSPARYRQAHSTRTALERPVPPVDIRARAAIARLARAGLQAAADALERLLATRYARDLATSSA